MRSMRKLDYNFIADIENGLFTFGIVRLQIPTYWRLIQLFYMHFMEFKFFLVNYFSFLHQHNLLWKNDVPCMFFWQTIGLVVLIQILRLTWYHLCSFPQKSHCFNMKLRATGPFFTNKKLWKENQLRYRSIIRQKHIRLMTRITLHTNIVEKKG